MGGSDGTMLQCHVGEPETRYLGREEGKEQMDLSIYFVR